MGDVRDESVDILKEWINQDIDMYVDIVSVLGFLLIYEKCSIK